MLTISGLRRRGYTRIRHPQFLHRYRHWQERKLDRHERARKCGPGRPERNGSQGHGRPRSLKVIIDNYPQGQSEELEAQNHPQNPEMGSRKLPFSREIYIERDDFMEDPPKKFFRLGPDREVRLRYGYFIRCVSVVKDAATERSRRSTAPMTRRPGAAPHLMAARSKAPSTGSLRRTPFRVRSGSMTVCS